MKTAVILILILIVLSLLVSDRYPDLLAKSDNDPDAAVVNDQSFREMYSSRSVEISAAQERGILNCYREITKAYEASDVSEVGNCIARLPEVCSRLDWATRRRVESPLVKSFEDKFLYCEQLQEFETSENLEEYLLTNFRVARFFGTLYGEEKQFDSQSLIEGRVYVVLKRYLEKYSNESKFEFTAVIGRYISEWERQIESPAGFTYSGVRRMVGLNTEYAEMIRPGSGMKTADAMVMAHSLVKGLIKAGYTPKWLDREFPLPNEDTVKNK